MGAQTSSLGRWFQAEDEHTDRIVRQIVHRHDVVVTTRHAISPTATNSARRPFSARNARDLTVPSGMRNTSAIWV